MYPLYSERSERSARRRERPRSRLAAPSQLSAILSSPGEMKMRFVNQNKEVCQKSSSMPLD